MSSCVPSMVHGSVSSFVASVYMIRHWRKNGFIDNDTVNQPNELALMQFSCVRPEKLKTLEYHYLSYSVALRAFLVCNRASAAASQVHNVDMLHQVQVSSHSLHFPA